MVEVSLRTFRADDAAWLAHEHAVAYARDEGFDVSFGALVTEILDDFVSGHDAACERGWIAQRDGARLGSIFCVASGEPGVAKLRLFYLVRQARGLGIGQRLLDTCLSFARVAGYTSLRLWTHESHRAACALYAKNGFRLTRSEPVHSFGVDLVEQTWEIDL